MPGWTLSTLVHGRGHRTGVGETYARAMQRWRMIRRDKRLQGLHLDPDALAAVLEEHYYAFDSIPGDGRDAMVVCGILQYYVDPLGFGDNLPKAQVVASALWKVNIDLRTRIEAVARLFPRLEFQPPKE